MKTKILGFYEKHLDNVWLRAIVPGAFAALVFLAKYVDQPWFIVVALTATAALPIHTYLISKASGAKLTEVNYWISEVKLHQWLLNVIKGMLLKKMERFRNRVNSSPAEEYSNAVIANLIALREFYIAYAYDPKNHFRITHFRPSDDDRYLITQFYSNADGTPPSSHGDIEAQKKYFSRETSTTLAVEAWKNRKSTVAESEREINYLYSQQRDKFRSIIASPVFENNDVTKRVIGVITITSSKEFFQKRDLERHKNYIEQFALRLVFEFCKLHSGNKPNNKTS